MHLQPLKQSSHARSVSSAASRVVSGFTLIELLVVIAIISILAAILFPVFATAREKSRQAQCLSNIKQQALGILQYAQDHDDVLPPVAYDTGSEEAEWNELIAPYLKNTQIHLCPSDGESEEISYGLNELGFVDLTDDPALRPKKLAVFQTTAETIMLGEVGTEDNLKTVRPDTLKMVSPSSPLNDDEDGRPILRHLERCNLGFMDGHAKAMKIEQFYKGQTPADKWFIP